MSTYYFNSLCTTSASSNPAERAHSDDLDYHWRGVATIAFDLSSIDNIEYEVTSVEAPNSGSEGTESTMVDRYSHLSGAISLAGLENEQQYQDHVERLMELVTQAPLSGGSIAGSLDALEHMFESKTVNNAVAVPANGAGYGELIDAFAKDGKLDTVNNKLVIPAGDEVQFTIIVTCAMEGNDEDSEYDPFLKTIDGNSGNALSDGDRQFRLRVRLVHTI